jgi:hypothetical protein
MNVLEEIQLGFDEAKQRTYRSMRKVFPRIDSSKSGTVNALVSGIALLYSTYQVFVKVIQGEVYVSDAQEFESLYKLIPMVGIVIDQPVAMSIVAEAQFQDVGITANPYYLGGENSFIDENSYPFLNAVKTYTKIVLYRFDDVTEYNWDSSIVFATGMFRREVYNVSGTDGRILYLSVKQLLGTEYVPISMLDGDSLVVEVPYIKGVDLLLAVVTFTRSGIVADTADVDTANCSLDNILGLIKIQLAVGNTFLNRNDEHDSLIGQPVNATYKVRSHVKNEVESADVDASTVIGAGIYSSAFVKKFTSKYIDLTDGTGLGAGDIGRNPGIELYSEIIIRDDLSAWTVAAGDRFGVLYLGTAVDETTLKIRHNTITALEFDFADAVNVVDDRWGTVPMVEVSYAHDIDAAGTQYTSVLKAYLLDASIGLIIFEYGWQWNEGAAENQVNAIGDYLIDYATKFNSKIVLDQYEENLLSITPDDVGETTFEYEFETDADPILFNEIEIDAKNAAGAIIDPEFRQVDDVSLYENTNTVNYFEVQPLLPTKVRIRFKDDDNLEIFNGTIVSLDIRYNTVKEIEDYKSGTEISGSAQLFNEDGTGPVDIGGSTEFNFDATNLVSQTGTGGVPGLESLRRILERAAYTYDKNVSRINYEAAIGTYYLNQGFDSLVKVFDYEDFGLTFINSTHGNIVFYIGIVNRYLNSDLILVVDTSMQAAWYGNDDSAELSISEFEALLFSGFTHISQLSNALINVITNGEAEGIRSSIKDDSVMTNYQLSQDGWILSWAVYFNFKLRSADSYTFAEAKAAAIKALSDLLKWSRTQFIRDINVSDVYNLIDDLPEVDKLLFTNFSHYKNSDTGNYKVDDIVYRTITSSTEPEDETLGVGQGSASVDYALQTDFWALDNTLSLLRDMLTIELDLLTVVGATSYEVPFFLIPYGAPVDLDGDGIAESYKLYLTIDGLTILTDITTNDYFSGYVNYLTGEITLLMADATKKDKWTNAIREYLNVNARVLGSVGAYAATPTASMDVVGIVSGFPIYASYTFSLESVRNENPLFNFSGVNNEGRREVKVDILALGGIEVEPY